MTCCEVLTLRSFAYPYRIKLRMTAFFIGQARNDTFNRMASVNTVFLTLRGGLIGTPEMGIRDLDFGTAIVEIAGF